MRILIVEDEHKIANALKRGLEQESYAVELEYDGEDGLHTALNESYDLIILDRMLPGVEGMEICKQLRLNKIHCPIIMLTAKDQLLKMLEWYTVATKGPKVDVWHIGSHMKLWLDSETWQELHHTFAHFDAEDSAKALLAEVKLFSRIGKVVAEPAKLNYHDDVDTNVTQYIQSSVKS